MKVISDILNRIRQRSIVRNDDFTIFEWMVFKKFKTHYDSKTFLRYHPMREDNLTFPSRRYDFACTSLRRIPKISRFT